MTDGQAMKIARRIQRLNEEITRLCQLLESQHPNGEEMFADLRDNMFDNPADATHVVHRCLSNPEAWEMDERTLEIRHKAATKAVQTRGDN